MDISDYFTDLIKQNIYTKRNKLSIILQIKTTQGLAYLQ